MNWGRYAIVAVIALLIGFAFGSFSRKSVSMQPVITGLPPFREGYPHSLFAVADPQRGIVTVFEADTNGVKQVGSERY